MNALRPTLVIGGTRGTGLLIVRLLHQRGQPVRVLARDPGRATQVLPRDVQVVQGDLTKPETLPASVAGVRHVVFTAGCRSGYPVREAQVKAVEYEGVVQTLAAARQTSFAGRFLYMNSSGLLTPTLFARCLNLWKGNTLVWRRRVEDGIRASGMEYTIIRAGVLVNGPGGKHRIQVTQHSLPLSLRYRISRADVAQTFLAALEHPSVRRATFEVVWGRPGRPEPWDALLSGVQADSDSSNQGGPPSWADAH